MKCKDCKYYKAETVAHMYDVGQQRVRVGWFKWEYQPFTSMTVTSNPAQCTRHAAWVEADENHYCGDFELFEL